MKAFLMVLTLQLLCTVTQASPIIQLRDPSTDVFWSPMVTGGPGTSIAMSVNWNLGIGKLEGKLAPEGTGSTAQAAYRATSTWSLDGIKAKVATSVRGQGEKFKLTFKDSRLNLCAEDSHFELSFGAPTPTWSSVAQDLKSAQPNNDCAKFMGIKFSDIQEIGFQTEATSETPFLIEFTELILIESND